MTDRSALKSPDAYRTISEVAEDLKLPQHVLRFWETRFPQVKPLKRAGGRRFYRPEDVDLLRAVKVLLYGDGYTIKGVQRILREQGPRAVAALAAGPVAIERARATPAPHPPIPPDDTADPRPEPPLPLTADREPSPAAFADPAAPAATGGAAPPDVASRLRAVLAELAVCEGLLRPANR